MSIILEALKRSQQERPTTGASPDLATHHYQEEVSDDRWARRLPWLGLGIALVLVIWLLLRSFQLVPREYSALPPPQNRVVTALAPEADSSQLSGGLVGPGRSSVSTPAAAESNGQAAAAQSTPVPPVQPVSAPPPPSSVVARTPPQQLAPDDSAVAAIYKQQSAQRKTDNSGTPQLAASVPVPAAKTEEVVDVEQLVLAARGEMAKADLPEHSAPFIADLPQAGKNEIPTLLYSRHDYAATGNSSVVLNSTTLGAGDTVSGAVKVEEILRDSVVLSHRGTRFRLRALNSWVNL